MLLLTLRVLGPLQVAIAGTPISTLESDKARALLAYLAVEADRPHRREALLGLFWPDCPEQTARHNLRQALFNVRQTIGDHTASPPYLLITRDEIQFNRASDTALGLARFNTLFNTCDKQLAKESGNRLAAGLSLEQLAEAAGERGDMSEASRFCQESIALYRETGDEWSLSRALTQLGDLQLEAAPRQRLDKALWKRWRSRREATITPTRSTPRLESQPGKQRRAA